jgi:hypothetical protein
MSDFIWGLTTRDIENAFWNGVSEGAMLVGGFAVAITANAISRVLLPNDRQHRASGMKHLVCTVIGITAGVLVSFSYADRLAHVTFVGEKALKFFVISLVTGAIGLKAGLVGTAIILITSGGAFGYFGRNALYANGALGAAVGSVVGSVLAATS